MSIKEAQEEFLLIFGVSIIAGDDVFKEMEYPGFIEV